MLIQVTEAEKLMT